jgi:chromosome segregation ATPase
MLIREVILENFMSYEYARIPLKEGVNVVCGPNGAGKSSFLLGICVALGDTYTERSKKLSDLIRWNAESARVTLLLDNTIKENGYRPVPQFDLDEIRLTRTLRRDGKYGFQLNQKNASKTEIVELLKTFGFDPDNMLIIMHQAMPTRFANLNPQDRLQILEEAVGYESFRKDVIEAKSKLGGILSEEESLNQLLNQARETLNYWREQNERLQEKRQLVKRQSFLQLEMAWSRVIALEDVLRGHQKELEDTDRELSTAEEEMERNTKRVMEAEEMLRSLRASWNVLIEKRIESERTVGINEHGIRSVKDRLLQIDRILRESQEQRRLFESSLQRLKDKASSSPATLDDYFILFNELESTQTRTYDNLSSTFIEQRNTLQMELGSMTQRLTEAEEEAGRLVDQMETLRVNIDNSNDQYIDGRIQLALLKDRRGRLRRSIEMIKSQIDRDIRDLKDAEAEALIRGPRVETGRSSDEILNEIRKTAGMLLGMSDVPEEAEEMYDNYSNTFKEIQQRIEEVKESRRQVLLEIEQRNRKWLEVTENLLDQVNVKYKKLLAKLQAVGETRLINPQDIEEAGLEIYVGFNGAVPQKLDPYTHSGGERSSSVIAFLLALQQNVLSPFRAVDEFDLHMDPRNKEAVSDFIVSTMEGTHDQYMAITPSQITFKGKDVHIIMVHKTEDVSVPKIVEGF